MTAARAFAQIVSWISTIVVMRLLAPADYGLVAMATLFTGYLLFLGDLGLGTALRLSERHPELSIALLERGERVVMVEDVATTGGQALEAVKVLEAAGAEVVAVIAVIDRQEGARENFEKAGVRFEALFTKGDLGVGD